LRLKRLKAKKKRGGRGVHEQKKVEKRPRVRSEGGWVTNVVFESWFQPVEEGESGEKK